MAAHEKSAGGRSSYAERVADTEVHIERIRAMLLAREQSTLAAEP